MQYQKLFLPVGGGGELEERIYGALLVAKFFKVHLEILKATPDVNQSNRFLPQNVIDDIRNVIKAKYEEENIEFQALLEKLSKQADVNVTEEILDDVPTVHASLKHGDRSRLVEQESKFCDLVVAAAPPGGVTTATFEAAVLKSGKPVLMIPRVMRKFDTKSIIIGWNNSPEVSRAVTSAMALLEKAERVHIITSKEYTSDMSKMDKLQEYLSRHGVEASVEVVETTRIPGQALLNNALDGNFNLIIAGAYGHKGLREMMFGGATKYLLEKSSLPVFMSH